MDLICQAQVDRPGFRLDLDVRVSSSATGVFGPSGCGKTTLLHLLAGLVRPTVARVVLDGVVLEDTGRGLRVPTHQRRLGLVFQEGLLWPHQDVRGNLTYGLDLTPVAERRFTLAQVVDLLDLGPLLDRRTPTLSGGERQRVALGRTLLTSPRLLLLDEPLAALDRGRKRHLLPLLRRIRDHTGIPLLLVGHDLAEVLAVTSDLLLMAEGRVVGQGPLPSLVAQPGALARLHDGGLLNVVPGTIASHHPGDGLTAVTVAGRTWWLPSRPEAPGTVLDLVLRAEDLILATGPVAGVSLQNRLEGTITALSTASERVVATVDAGIPLASSI